MRVKINESVLVFLTFPLIYRVQPANSSTLQRANTNATATENTISENENSK